MASGPIPSWQIKGKKVETVTNFIFLGSKITADGDCSHEIKRLLGRKAMASSVLKAMKKCIESYRKRRYHFADKGLYSQSYGLVFFFFPVVLYRCENWIIKRLSAEELMLLLVEKTLENPLDSKESKPVNPKENQP